MLTTCIYFCIVDNNTATTEAPTAALSSQHTITLCSVNNNKKYEPVSFHLWMNILRRVPASVLHMMAESAVVRDNLLSQAKYHGIAEGRIRWFDKVSLLCMIVL